MNRRHICTEATVSYLLGTGGSHQAVESETSLMKANVLITPQDTSPPEPPAVPPTESTAWSGALPREPDPDESVRSAG